jgi:hypothetical protein
MDDLLGAYPSALYLGLQPCVVLLQIDHAVDHLFFILVPAASQWMNFCVGEKRCEYLE